MVNGGKEEVEPLRPPEGFGGKFDPNLNSYLMEISESSDKGCLFGFSRGVKTVRLLAGLLHALGSTARQSYLIVRYVMQLFKSVRASGTIRGPKTR